MSQIILNRKLSRRSILRGFGATIGLPLLDAMTPARVFAAAGKAPAKPTRLAFLYIPNGVNMQDWTPTTQGSRFAMPYLLSPVAEFRDRMTVLSGLTLDKARAHGDGPGDHARAMVTFLTGAQPRKTSGANIRAGVSADQIAAAKIGDRTRFPSLEIGCEGGGASGSCDSGYACVYQHNLSWRSETTPMSKEINPKQVFERLFGADSLKEAATSQARRDARKRSILDSVQEDAKSLQAKLGDADRRKLDEYLTGVREVERRISRPASSEAPFKPNMAVPAGVPKDFATHARLMADLLVFAFQSDSTRVATFAFGNDGSTRNYPTIGVPDGHHDISHHGKDRTKIDKIKKINIHHMEQLAYFLGRLQKTPDGDSNLLDRSMIVYGSGLGDGDRHNHDDLPILLFGKGNGALKPGRHIVYPKETPLMNLHLALLQRIGAPTHSLGDSTGVLPGLS